eukprot:c29284_g2_i2 orf=901-3231(+)
MEAKRDRRTFPANPSEYQLLEEVGHGVSAVVYRATCTQSKTVVAIKCLDLERCNSNLEDIRREAQLMSLIDHPNVIKSHCSFVVDHFLWVVMPYMEGGSCLHIMKVSYPDGFEEQMIATILKETLKALDYLHRQGHIHRDVKAGNILIDEIGGVKLGDFGVSACMFDRGDRQRSRNTFVGTPCWMAPEVMEQKGGYNFKADIWSFGITALELAHGHAPFSRYPPMKVLLMTIQNAPPGLDYERDKRFSKAFREMISMCLVKDPSKRPTAEKLLKHSFFKKSKSNQYIAQHLLSGLAPLWERERTLKEMDAARLAQNGSLYVDQEVKSRNEYKRSMSAWNFNVEDLKIQAALEDNGIPIVKSVLCNDSMSSSGDSEISYPIDPCSLKLEDAHAVDNDASHIQPGNSSFVVPPLSLTIPNDGLKSSFTRKKEPKQIGRFGVFDGDVELESPGWHECIMQQRIIIDEAYQRNGREHEIREDYIKSNQSVKKQGIRNYSGPLLPQKIVNEVRDPGKALRTSSGPLVPQRVTNQARDPGKALQASSGPPLPQKVILETRNMDRGECHNCPRMANEEPIVAAAYKKDHSFRVPLACTTGSLEQLLTNGPVGVPNSLTGIFNSLEEKPRGVTSQKDINVSMASVDNEVKEGVCQASLSSIATNTATVPSSALVPQLQALLLQTATQYQTILNILRSVSPGDVQNGKYVHHLSPNQALDCGRENYVGLSIEPDQELADLQSKVTSLVSELEAVKLRNVQLERQLNALHNREEEKKIKREEAVRD